MGLNDYLKNHGSPALLLVISSLFTSAYLFIQAILIVKFLGSSFSAKALYFITIINFISVVAGLGFSVSIIRKYSHDFLTYKGIDKHIVSYTSISCFIFSFLMILILYIANLQFDILKLYGQQAFTIILLLTLSSFLIARDIFYKSCLNGLELYSDLAKITLLQFLLNIMALIFGIFFIDPQFIFYVILVNALINWLISKALYNLATKKISKISIYNFSNYLVFIKSQGVPTLLSSMLIPFAHFFANFNLSKNNIDEISLYVLMIQITNLLVFIPNNIGKLLIPIYTSNKKLMAQNNIIKTSFIFSIFTFLPYIVISYSELINIYIFEDTIGEYFNVINVFLFSSVIASFCVPIGNSLIAKSKFWVGSSLNLNWSLIFVILPFIFGEYSLKYLSISFFLAYMIHALVLVILNLKYQQKN